MTKKSILILAATAVLLSACQRDVYGHLFVNRQPVTFRVLTDSGLPLPKACVKTEELDAFDYDLIIDGTHYAITDAAGLVTVKAVFDEEDGYSRLGERTNRFTFSADGYADHDTVFNYWEDTIAIVLHRE